MISSPLEDINFRKNVVFGTVPIGYPGDISLNLIRHINQADIILVETLVSFYQLILGVNKFLSQFGFSEIQLTPKAKIYAYTPDDNSENKEIINKKIIKEINSGKKVLVVSEEGYSNYMDPAEFLKITLIINKIEFDTLHGPCMVIATLATSHFVTKDFIFAGNVAWWSDNEIFDRLQTFKNTNMPIIFSFDSNNLKRSLETINTVFPDYMADFCANLSKPNEAHIRGKLDEIIYTHENILKDNNTDRCTLIIKPGNNFGAEEEKIVNLETC
jgi:16S rRNA (cytidine1402-2'-O)-methyltransferase